MPWPARKRPRAHSAVGETGGEKRSNRDTYEQATSHALSGLVNCGDVEQDSDQPLFVEDSFCVEDDVVADSMKGTYELSRMSRIHRAAAEPVEVFPGTPRRSRLPSNRSSPMSSPQKLQKAGFSEPNQHPTRQPPYKRPRFKSAGSGSLPQAQVPPPSVVDMDASARIGRSGDMDEGAAGISSDYTEDSALIRRMVAEPTEQSSHSHVGDALMDEPSRDQPREGALNLVGLHGSEDGNLDESIVPDSQPVTPPELEPEPAETAHVVPVDSVLNTTSEALLALSPPSMLTAGTQDLSQSHSMSRERLFRWLQHKEGCRPYFLSDFIEKHCGPSTKSVFAEKRSAELSVVLASYVVNHESQVDGPAKMLGRHKDLADDDSKSPEAFFRRILYEMHTRQKNVQSELEILYGPWSDLALIFGRAVIVFILLYTSVYKLVGESQWLQITGEVPRFQLSRNPSTYQQNQGSKYVTKRDIVFREFRRYQTLRLPPLTPEMQKLFPPELKQALLLVEKRARPMRFLFEHIHVNTEGWTSRQKVAKFLLLCMKKLFPRAVLGSTGNCKAFEMTVRRFVNMSAMAKMPLGQAAHGIKLNEIPWARQLCAGKHKASALVVMPLFWEWVFEHFLKPMLAQHFYMTEMSGVAMSLYYYELSVWTRKVKAAGTKAFIEQHGGKEQLGTSNDGERLRFVPKQTGGVRPIVNLKEFNQTLKLAHVVLGSLPQSQTRLENWQSWFLPLEAFKSRHPAPPGGKFYTVKLDISGCYDNVKKEKLEEVVRKHLADGEEEFWLQTHSMFDSRSNLIRDRYSAFRASELFTAARTNQSLLPIQQNRRPNQPALVYFSKVTGNLRVQGTRLPPDKRMLHGFPYSGHEVLSDIARLLHNLRIQAKPSKTLPFNTGIPQGSSCSLDLCNLLLDDLVHTKLSEFVADPRCLVLRYVDDFLFVTTSREMAQSYQSIMLRGFREDYGFFCKEEKQQSNLGDKRVRMEYLGYEFDPDTLEVYPKKLRQTASAAPLPLYKTALVQRMHVNLESLLGPLRSYRRAGMSAPLILEKKVSRAFGKFVADSYEACSAFVKETDLRAVFQNLVRTKLLPLVSPEHRTSMLKAAQNMFLIRIQKKPHLLTKHTKLDA